MRDNPSTASGPPPLTQGRLTKWEGRDEDGPRAVLIRRDHFPTAMQEALRKLAMFEDEEERRADDIRTYDVTAVWDAMRMPEEELRAVWDAGPYTGDMGNE